MVVLIVKRAGEGRKRVAEVDSHRGGSSGAGTRRRARNRVHRVDRGPSGRAGLVDRRAARGARPAPSGRPDRRRHGRRGARTGRRAGADPAERRPLLRLRHRRPPAPAAGRPRVRGGRYFGFVIGGSVPAATGADWLTTAWDQNAGLALLAPSAAVVEEVAGRWLKDLLDVPEHASFALVTGCQMAHVTALLAARHHV